MLSLSWIIELTAPLFEGVSVQILALDKVFSLDSVITAVGMVDELFIMVAAVTIAIGIMLVQLGDQRLRQPAPDRQDARPGIPSPHRRELARRGPRLPHAEGIHVRPHRLRDSGGSSQPPLQTVQARRRHVHVEPVHLRQAYLKEAGAPVVDQRHAQSGPDRSPDQARPGE